MKPSFSDLFHFEKFFTPLLIKVLYLVYIIGGGIWTLFGVIRFLAYSNEMSSAFSEYGEGFDASLASQIVGFGVAGSIVGYLVGILLLRLLFEAMIVVFNIYSNLRSMRNSLASGNATTINPPLPN